MADNAPMRRDMTAALIMERGKILLVHNTKHNGLRIEPPGGKKRAGEGWEESVAREVAEELGVRVRAVRLFGDYPTHSPEGDFLVRMFVCEITSGVPALMEPDVISDFGWYGVDALEKLAEDGLLVPNMVAALDRIKDLLLAGRA